MIIEFSEYTKINLNITLDSIKECEAVVLICYEHDVKACIEIINDSFTLEISAFSNICDANNFEECAIEAIKALKK